MTDGHSAVQDGAETAREFERIGELEGKLIISSKFGDNVTEETINLAKTIIRKWNGYVCLKGLNKSPKRFYAASHAYALGSFIEGKIDFGRLWEYLNNRISGDLTPEQAEESRRYMEKYTLSN